MEPNKKKQKRPIVFDKITVITLAVFLILAIFAGIAVFRLSQSIIATWTMTNLEGIPVPPKGTNDSNNPQGSATESNQPDKPIQINAGPTPEPWDGVSRITVLLMGLDYRDWESGEVPRSDTMILLSMDPLTKTAAIMSIPRDMWVNIPGFEYDKINTAYRLGEVYDLPGGGPALAMETVKQFLGVPIDYYAQIDFSAFVRFIDEIKGVSVTPETDVKIDPIGDGFKQTLKAGETVTLPGDLALGYARARYTEGGDFDRAKRQQEVILSIRKRILSYDMLPLLITKAPTLYNEISSGIKTNLALDQVIRLAVSAMNIEREDIATYIIDNTAVELGKTPDGTQDILIPIPDKIRLLRDQAFSSGGPVGPAAIQNDTQNNSLVSEESARVSIQNGSWMGGLAASSSEYLRQKGFNVIEEVDGQATDVTTIYLYNSKPYTVKFVFDLFEKAGLYPPRMFNRMDLGSSTDIAIVWGNDWANYISANNFPPD